MNWPRATKLRRLVRTGAQRIAPSSLILLYHRIAESPCDPWLLCVSPHHFAEHLEVLRGRVASLTQVCRGELDGRRAKGRIAITFDDGYADALHAALPLLERHNAPATVFVATGGVDDGRPFWWDELAALFEPGRELPGHLELEVRGEHHHFDLERDVNSLEGHGPEAWAGPRGRLHGDIHALLADLDASHRREQLAALRAWAGVTSAMITTDRALTRDEILRLGAGGLVELGAHTVSHPKLPALEPIDQEREIRDSQAFLARLLGRPVTSFAYPHGCYDTTTRRLLGDAGFHRACTTELGRVKSRTDALLLPRIEVPDCDGDAFARLLRWWGF